MSTRPTIRIIRNSSTYDSKIYINDIYIGYAIYISVDKHNDKTADVSFKIVGETYTRHYEDVNLEYLVIPMTI